jgi:hypothetical protein
MEMVCVCVVLVYVMALVWAYMWVWAQCLCQNAHCGRLCATPRCSRPRAAGQRSYHCAPTPTLVATDGRLYRAYEVTTDTVGLGSVMMRTILPYDPTTSNLLDPQAWELSSVASFPPKPAGWDPRAHFVWQEVRFREKSVLVVVEELRFRLKKVCSGLWVEHVGAASSAMTMPATLWSSPV